MGPSISLVLNICLRYAFVYRWHVVHVQSASIGRIIIRIDGLFKSNLSIVGKYRSITRNPGRKYTVKNVNSSLHGGKYIFRRPNTHHIMRFFCWQHFCRVKGGMFELFKRIHQQKGPQLRFPVYPALQFAVRHSVAVNPQKSFPEQCQIAIRAKSLDAFHRSTLRSATRLYSAASEALRQRISAGVQTSKGMKTSLIKPFEAPQRVPVLGHDMIHRHETGT